MLESLNQITDLSLDPVNKIQNTRKETLYGGIMFKVYPLRKPRLFVADRDGSSETTSPIDGGVGTSVTPGSDSLSSLET